MKPILRSAAALMSPALALVAVPAAAHHSAAMYDQVHLSTIEATVKSFEWINPHSVLEVSTPATPALPGGDLTVEMSSPGVMTRAGFTKRTFQPGDKIKLTYAPLRAGGPVGMFMQAVTPAGLVLSWSFKAGEKAGIE